MRVAAEGGMGLLYLHRSADVGEGDHAEPEDERSMLAASQALVLQWRASNALWIGPRIAATEGRPLLGEWVAFLDAGLLARLQWAPHAHTRPHMTLGLSGSLGLFPDPSGVVIEQDASLGLGSAGLLGFGFERSFRNSDLRFMFEARGEVRSVHEDITSTDPRTGQQVSGEISSTGIAGWALVGIGWFP